MNAIKSGEAIPPLKSRLEDFEDAMSFRSGKAES